MMRKTIYFLLGIFAFITSVTETYAVASWDVGSGFASTGDTVVETPQNKEPISLDSDGNKSYYCQYTSGVTSQTQYSVSIYNLENEEILNNNFTINENKMPLAGTSVGINIKETKKIKWEVTGVELTVNKIEEKTEIRYNCTYTNKTPAQMLPNSANGATMMAFGKSEQIAFDCATKYNSTNNDKPCENKTGCNFVEKKIYNTYTETDKNTYTLNSNISDNKDKDMFNKCKAIAIDEAVKKANWNITASYSLEMTDSNDINGTNSVKISKNEASNTMRYTEGNGIFTVPTNDSLSDKRKIEIFYKKYKTCINVQTSNVTYKGKNENCDLKTELEISNESVDGLEHWHYFIPLNTKSNDSINIKMSPGNEILSKQQCLYVMKNNQIDSGTIPYVDLIKPANGGEFAGNYRCISENCDPKTGDFNEYSSDYNEVNNNGCQLTSNAKIYSQQKFYLEDNSKSFKGFNFYYKPINPSNENAANIIFPNGVIKDENGYLTFNSLWSDWYKTQTTKGTASPDLSKSYNEVTYIAQNININKIREYNKKYDYTDWTTMSVNGTSNFVDYEGIIERNNNLPSVYKLGCGPANITTQKGCGVK